MATCIVRRASVIASALFRPHHPNPDRLFHSSVFRSDVYKNADLDTFTKVTQAKDRVVLVDFYADWCGPCRQLSPILEKLCSDSNVKSGITGHPLDLVKIDVESDDGGILAQQYKVAALPTVFAFQNGKHVSQFQGAMPEHAVRKFLEGI